MPLIEIRPGRSQAFFLKWKEQDIAPPEGGWTPGWYYLHLIENAPFGEEIDWYYGPCGTVEALLWNLLEQTAELDFTEESWSIQKAVEREDKNLFRRWVEQRYVAPSKEEWDVELKGYNKVFFFNEPILGDYQKPYIFQSIYNEVSGPIEPGDFIKEINKASDSIKATQRMEEEL